MHLSENYDMIRCEMQMIDRILDLYYKLSVIRNKYYSTKEEEE